MTFSTEISLTVGGLGRDPKPGIALIVRKVKAISSGLTQRRDM